MFRTRTAAAVLAACTLACLAVGCAGQQVRAWPIYSRSTGEERTTHEALGPLVTVEAGPERHYHAVRPLYNYESTPQLSRLQYLWPLGVWYSRTDDVSQHRFLPLVSLWSRPETGGSSSFIFPFFWWGSSPGEGPYFAVFPIGGVTHGVLGDTWSWAGFPVFSYYRHLSYRRYDVLWPFFTIGGTPDGRRTVRRAWPLYVHRSVKDRSDRYYVLWPFIGWGSEARDTENPSHLVHVWPFYAAKNTVNAEGETVAYDRHYFIYGRQRDTRERRRLWGWSLFWRTVLFLDAPEKDISRVWPFYWSTTWYRGRQKKPESAWTRYRILWPVIWLDRNRREKGIYERNFVLAPFYWDYRRAPTDGEGKVAREVTLWPLMTLDWNREGAFRFWLLSHGWDDPPQGFKRNYSPLIDLFHYHSLPGGRRETELLWGLYRHRRGPKGRQLGLMPFFSYDTSYEEGSLTERVVSVLFGLVQYRSGGRSPGWRIFYLGGGG